MDCYPIIRRMKNLHEIVTENCLLRRIEDGDVDTIFESIGGSNAILPETLSFERLFTSFLALFAAKIVVLKGPVLAEAAIHAE